MPYHTWSDIALAPSHPIPSQLPFFEYGLDERGAWDLYGDGDGWTEIE